MTVAFAGSGGKTTAIFQIARELLQQKKHRVDNLTEANETVIVTTTTHFGSSQISLSDKHQILDTNQVFDDHDPTQS